MHTLPQCVNMPCSSLATDFVMQHGLYSPHCQSHRAYKQHCCHDPHSTWLHSLTDMIMQLHTHGVIFTAPFSTTIDRVAVSHQP